MEVINWSILCLAIRAQKKSRSVSEPKNSTSHAVYVIWFACLSASMGVESNRLWDRVGDIDSLETANLICEQTEKRTVENNLESSQYWKLIVMIYLLWSRARSLTSIGARRKPVGPDMEKCKTALRFALVFTRDCWISKVISDDGFAFEAKG